MSELGGARSWRVQHLGHWEHVACSEKLGQSAVCCRARTQRFRLLPCTRLTLVV